MSDLSDSVFGVEFSRSNISIDLPLQIGFSILNYAKLSILSFYYDFLLKYLNRNDFEFLECDTDSSYIALYTQKLDECILPHMKEQFGKGLQNCCSADRYEPTVDNWFARTCCQVGWLVVLGLTAL